MQAAAAVCSPLPHPPTSLFLPASHLLQAGNLVAPSPPPATGAGSGLLLAGSEVRLAGYQGSPLSLAPGRVLLVVPVAAGPWPPPPPLTPGAVSPVAGDLGPPLPSGRRASDGSDGRGAVAATACHVN